MLIPNIQGFSFVVIGRNCHLILTIHYQDRYFLNINPCLSYFVSQCGTYSFMPRIVGLGALKYFILKVDARKNMTFNPKESIDFNGNTGPFIQYTYARIQSVLRKATESGIVIPEQIPAGIELSEKEEGLIQMVADFAAVVKQAGEDYSPSIIANYTYDLVKEYNQFYHDYSILREENEAVKVFRIALSANVAKVVRLGMNLLGIEVPSRM